MSDASLFVGREVGVRRGSFCNKRTRLTPTSITAEISRCFGGVVCGVWLRQGFRAGYCNGGRI